LEDDADKNLPLGR